MEEVASVGILPSSLISVLCSLRSRGMRLDVSVRSKKAGMLLLSRHTYNSGSMRAPVLRTSLPRALSDLLTLSSFPELTPEARSVRVARKAVRARKDMVVVFE